MLTVAIVGCVVVLACGYVLASACRRIRAEFQRQIDALSSAVRVLERTTTADAAVAAVPTLSGTANIEVAAAQSNAPLALLPVAAHQSSVIPPEALATIKATLTALLGRKVRIRSVKLLEDPEAPTTWATQGRVAVQMSHSERAPRCEVAAQCIAENLDGEQS